MPKDMYQTGLGMVSVLVGKGVTQFLLHSAMTDYTG